MTLQEEISQFAKIDNEQFRLLKALTPGPYTFIFEAKRSVPNRLVHPRRRTIGVRIPDHHVVHDLLAMLGEPLMSSSLILPGDSEPIGDPDEIRARLEHQVNLIISAGTVPNLPSTVIDWHGDNLEIARMGAGSVAFLEQ